MSSNKKRDGTLGKFTVLRKKTSHEKSPSKPNDRGKSRRGTPRSAESPDDRKASEQERTTQVGREDNVEEIKPLLQQFGRPNRVRLRSKKEPLGKRQVARRSRAAGRNQTLIKTTTKSRREGSHRRGEEPQKESKRSGSEKGEERTIYNAGGEGI